MSTLRPCTFEVLHHRWLINPGADSLVVAQWIICIMPSACENGESEKETNIVRVGRWWGCWTSPSVLLLFPLFWIMKQRFGPEAPHESSQLGNQSENGLLVVMFFLLGRSVAVCVKFKTGSSFNLRASLLFIAPCSPGAGATAHSFTVVSPNWICLVTLKDV